MQTGWLDSARSPADVGCASFAMVSRATSSSTTGVMTGACSDAQALPHALLITLANRLLCDTVDTWTYRPVEH